MRRDVLKGLVAAGLGLGMTASAQAKSHFKPVTQAVTVLAPFKASAFPYHGQNPETGEPFMNVSENGRIGHKSPRGGVKWEDETYFDTRTLVHLPKGFSLAKPAAIVVYFHGNNSTLERDVLGAQHVPDQLAASGLNAALLVPQLAVDARDSSAGHFWREGFFAEWLEEGCHALAKLYGQKSRHEEFAALPVIVVAYSGGYYPLAWSLKQGGARSRIRGVVLFDALYGDVEKFTGWAEKRHKEAFLFSAYTPLSAKWNLDLLTRLKTDGIHAREDFPETLKPGGFHFAAVPETVDHFAFMTEAWVPDPMEWALNRVKLG